jgi:hypothetical protein
MLHELGLMKRLLSRSRFSRRMNRLADLISQLFHQLGSVLTRPALGVALLARFVSGSGLR